MDYGYIEKRKTKGDKKAKARYNKYKKGGQYRATNVNVKNNVEN
jgi:hypothetical protein